MIIQETISTLKEPQYSAFFGGHFVCLKLKFHLTYFCGNLSFVINAFIFMMLW